MSAPPPFPASSCPASTPVTEHALPPAAGNPGFAEHSADRRFTETVETWSNLVFSTALRRLDGDAGNAREVMQNVFLTAHRKSEILARVVCPAAWFHRAAMLESSNFLRAERRRRRKLEALAKEQALIHPPAAFSFPPSAASGTVASIPEALRAQLDEALDALRDPDRELVLSRFFEGHSFQELAARRRSTPDAVRVKLNRILEKLASLLRRRGIAVTALSLTTALTTQWTQAAPAALTASLIAAGTVSGTGCTAAAAVSAVSSTMAVPAAFSGKIPFILTLMSSAKTIGLTSLALLIALLSLKPQDFRIEELKAKLARHAARAGGHSPANRSAAAPGKPGTDPVRSGLLSDTGKTAEDILPVTVREILKQVRSSQRNGFGSSEALSILSKRLRKMSVGELLDLVSGIDAAQAGAGLKSLAREQLISGFLVKKDPMAAIQQAIRLRFQDEALRKLAANLVKTEKDAGVQRLAEFLKTPDSLPAARFGSDPARALRQGIGEGLAAANRPAAIQLCREAAGTPAAADYLLGMTQALARKDSSGTFFELLNRVPETGDRRAILARITWLMPSPETFVNDPLFPQELRKDAVLGAALEVNSSGEADNSLYALHVIAAASRPQDRQATTVDWLRQGTPPAQPGPYYPKAEEEHADRLIVEALRLAAPADAAAAQKWLVLVHDPERRTALATELNLTAP